MLTRATGKDWWGGPNRSTFAIDIPDIEAPEFEHLMGVLGWQHQGQDSA